MRIGLEQRVAEQRLLERPHAQLGDQRLDLRLVRPEPGGTEVKRAVAVADAEQASADAVARLMDRDGAPRRQQGARCGEAGDARAHHDDVAATCAGHGLRTNGPRWHQPVHTGPRFSGKAAKFSTARRV